MFLAKLLLFNTRTRTEMKTNTIYHFILVWIPLISLTLIWLQLFPVIHFFVKKAAFPSWDNCQECCVTMNKFTLYNSHLHIQYRPHSSHFIREQATAELRRAMPWCSDRGYLGHVRWWTEMMKYYLFNLCYFQNISNKYPFTNVTYK